MSIPIPPKTHVDTSTQSTQGKKAESKETHPLTDLAAESLNIGSDLFDLNLDLDLDLSDLNIEILNPEDPSVSNINELSLEVLNFDLPEVVNITRNDVLSFLSNSIDSMPSQIDTLFFKGAVGICFDNVGHNAENFLAADLVFIPQNNVFILKESMVTRFNQNKEKFANQFNVPLHKLNVVILSDDEWSSFTSKLYELTLTDGRENKNTKSLKEEKVESKEKTQRQRFERETSKSHVIKVGDKTTRSQDAFSLQKGLQEEANALEVLRLERENAREKRSRDEKQRIEEKELNREILKKSNENVETKKIIEKTRRIKKSNLHL